MPGPRDPRPGPLAPPAPGAGSVLAARPDLADEVARLGRLAHAPATRRALAADWRVWSAWCAEHGAAALPATPDTAAGFLADLGRTHALASLLRYRATVGKAHRLAGHPSPFADQRVGAVLEGIRREKGPRPPRQKAALRPVQISQALAGAEAKLTQETQALRDRALLLVGVTSAMRRSEICALEVTDLDWRDAGVVVTVRRSKTDQAGAGREVALPRLDDQPLVCPVRALRRWLDVIRNRAPGTEEAGPLFRPIVGFEILNRPLDPRAVGRAVKRAVRALGLDPAAFGGHSLRAGYVTEARAQGQGWGEIMEQTGHRKVETAKRYVRERPDPFVATKVADVYRAAFTARSLRPWLAEERLEGVTVTRIGLPVPPTRLVTRFREGSDEHRRLCASAAAWLEAQGLKWTLADRRYAGGLADLAVPKERLYVEAGDTDLAKIEAALGVGERVLLAPFGFDGVVGFMLSGRPSAADKWQDELRAAAASLDRAFKPKGGESDGKDRGEEGPGPDAGR